MIRFADPRLSPAQALLCGRVFDSVSGRGLTGFTATLGYEHPAGDGLPATDGPLRVRLGHRSDGWFVFTLPDARRMPDVPGTVQVTLTARVAVPGRAPAEASHTVAGTRLAVVLRTVDVGGHTLEVPGIPDAPWSVSVPIAPRPVAVDGIVLRGHDPGDPIPGVTVTAAGTSPVTTDAAGRFFIAALPVLAAVPLTLREPDGTTWTETFRPDFDRPVNVLTLSLPLPD
jgi:hypothetical protein